MFPLSVGAAPGDVAADKLTPEAIEIELLIKQGKRLVEDNDLDKAIEVFNNVVKLNSNNAEAHYHLGIIYVRKNDAENALRFLHKSVGLVPRNARVRRALALAYERFDRLDSAIRQYRIIIEEAPGTPEAIEADKNLNLLLVRQYAESGNQDAALGLIGILRRDYSSDPRVLHAVGLAYFNFNRLEDAEAVFKQVTQLSSGSATAYFYLGRVYEKAVRVPLAIEQYKRAVMLEPGTDLARRATIRLGVIKATDFLKKEDLQGALKEFQAVLELDPNERGALFNSGTIYRQLKKLGESETMFKRLIILEPRNLEAHLRLGALYLEMDKLVESSRVLEKVISLGKDSPHAKQAEALLAEMQSKYGDKLTVARRFADERDSYQDALTENPNDSAAHFNLGVLYARNLMRDEALHEFLEVVRIEPGHAKAHHYIGIIYDDKTQFPEAIESYAKAISLEQDPAEVAKVIALLQMAAAKKLYADGRHNLANDYFNDLLVTNPDNVMALFYKALIQSVQGDLGGAERLYKRILEIRPGYIGARFRLAFLYEQSNREEDAIKEYRYMVQNGGTDADTSAVVNDAKRKIPLLERRINGFTYNIGYAITYDNNSNLSDAQPFYEYISNLSSNFTYRYKLARDIRSGISFSPAYIIYHYTQSDFLRSDIGPFVTFGPTARNVTLGMTRTDMSGLLNEQRVSIADNFYADSGWRFDSPAFLKWLAQPEEIKNTNTLVRFNLSYRNLLNQGSPFFDSETYSTGGSLAQALGKGRSATLDFNYTDSQNKNPQGRDYAYRGVSAMMRLDQSFSPRLSGNVAYSFGFNYYLYPDALYRSVNGADKNRITMLHSITFGLGYDLNDRIRAYAGGSFQLADSSLPVGYVLTPEDVIGVGRALGAYKKVSLTAGMTLNF